MKQLTNKQHLCYMLENSHLVTSLPFIDQELDTIIPKSKVSYLIRAQQQIMQKDAKDYIRDLYMPELSFANSDDFEKQVQRVKEKQQQKQKGKVEGQSKKNEVSPFPEMPKKVFERDHSKLSEQVDQGILIYCNNITKNINLEISKKYGPLVFKELIEVLQKHKTNLQSSITQEKNALEQLHKNRKYEQMQTYQRQNDIGERVKIMLNKRRKVE